MEESQENTVYTTSSTEKLLSACTGALLTSLLMTPMDVVKLRLQTQPYNPSKPLCCSTTSIKKDIRTCIWSNGIQHSSKSFYTRSPNQIANLHECAVEQFNRPYLTKQPLKLTGTLDGFYTIAKYEGMSGLWKGLSPALLMSVPSNVIYFVGYDYLKVMIQPTIATPHSDYSPLIAGGVARTIAVTLISPIELFRTRLQATSGVNDFKHVLQGVNSMVKKDGVRALWRGLPPTLWRDVPFSALYWMTYENTKQSLLVYADSSDAHPVLQNDLRISFIAGAFSGMVAAAITTPFDVAKTKRQVEAGQDMPKKTVNVSTILRQIYDQQGIRGLFRGMTPRVAKVAPSCAIMISSYEVGKTFFSKQHTEAL
ncbi:putative mitochondrial carrier protein [Spinellus fusiger]|nr:putative mitochondrial carrier protein [Spinellus fusiger]